MVQQKIPNQANYLLFMDVLSTVNAGGNILEEIQFTLNRYYAANKKIATMETILTFHTNVAKQAKFIQCF